MRKYTLPYAILAAIILAGTLMFALMQQTSRKQEADYVALNEIAKLAARHWQTPDELNREEIAYRYTIIDNDGLVLFSSDPNLPDSLPTAIRLGFVPMDITVESAVVGKALIEASPGDAAREAKARLTAAVFVAFALIAALNFAFLFALHNALIKPFKRLQSFAHRISAGALEEPNGTSNRSAMMIGNIGLDRYVRRRSCSDPRFA